MCPEIGQQFPMVMEIPSLQFAALCLCDLSLDSTVTPWWVAALSMLRPLRFGIPMAFDL